MFASKDLFLTRPSGYQISRSVRLRSSASAYFNRTPASAGNRQVMTFSWWMKLGNTTGAIFGAPATTNPRMQIYYNGPSDGRFELYQSDSGGTQVCYTLTTARYRDPSAWYHFVIAIDTTQATASNRIKWYVNGVQLTAFDTAAYPAQNTNMEWNAAAVHNIGRQPNGGSYFDGYLTEINFIDGQALTPSSFGQTNTVTGVWQPIKYTGTYGTNGFYLNFSDNSNNTATTIGKDYSGNGNNWTPNNISVTAGTTYDSMLDVPTPYADGGNGRGNYAVFNPLWRLGGSGYITPTNGNLRASIGSTNNIISSTIQLPSSGKWYMEFTLTTAQYAEYGLCGPTANGGGGATNIYGAYYNGSNLWFANGSNGSSDGNVANTSGDVGLIAVDVSNNKLWIGRIRSGTTVWMGGGNPSSGTNPSFSASGGGGVYATTFDAQTFNNPFVASGAGADVWDANFGQQPWIGTPPTGFVALNTLNLPAGSITTSGTFTGNASTDGPFVYLNGVPTTMTINGNAVTFGTNADHLANGFKVRSASSSYNASGSNTYSVTVTGANFKYANAQTNP